MGPDDRTGPTSTMGSGVGENPASMNGMGVEAPHSGPLPVVDSRRAP